MWAKGRKRTGEGGQGGRTVKGGRISESVEGGEGDEMPVDVLLL